MVRKYIGRSLRYNGMLREQVKRFGMKSVSVREGMKPEDIADDCMQVLQLQE